MKNDAIDFEKFLPVHTLQDLPCLPQVSHTLQQVSYATRAVLSLTFCWDRLQDLWRHLPKMKRMFLGGKGFVVDADGGNVTGNVKQVFKLNKDIPQGHWSPRNCIWRNSLRGLWLVSATKLHQIQRQYSQYSIYSSSFPPQSNKKKKIMMECTFRPCLIFPIKILYYFNKMLLQTIKPTNIQFPGDVHNNLVNTWHTVCIFIYSSSMELESFCCNIIIMPAHLFPN